MKIYIVMSDTQYDNKILREKVRDILYKPDNEKVFSLYSNPRTFKEIKCMSDCRLIDEYKDLVVQYRPGTFSSYCSFFDFGGPLYGLRLNSCGPKDDLYHIPTHDNFNKVIGNSVGFSFINDNCIHKEILQMIIYHMTNKLNLSNYTIYFRTEYEDVMTEFTKDLHTQCASTETYSKV